MAIVTAESNILLIDDAGKIIRLPAKEVRSMGRQAKGVRLIKLDKGQTLSNISSFEGSSEDDEKKDGPKDPTSNIPKGVVKGSLEESRRADAMGDGSELETLQMADEQEVESEVRLQPAQPDSQQEAQSQTDFDALAEHAEAEMQESLFVASDDDAVEDDPFAQF